MSDQTFASVTLSRWDLEQMLLDTHPFIRLRFPAPGTSSGEVSQMLQQITTEMKKMSDQNAQVAADVTQIQADVSTLRGAFATMAQKIADLQASAGSAGVAPALQAQIDDLHAFAQSVTPPAAPAG